ncbi:MAG: hypothetical protein RQ801_00950 [Spirochaetaceae bacterium]|nr:hypothetical protein [Spirochaetaceae bacterium]MDT8296838.1 hypothetical protein [Spirochaetaceae bacterium]
MKELSDFPKSLARRASRTAFVGFVLFNGLYILILYLASLVSGSVEEIRRLWPWGLAVGSLFAVQIGLFSYTRQVLQKRKTGAGSLLAVSGGGSLGSMVACCAHLLPLFLPFLGISLISGLLIQLQMPMIIAALFINSFGILSQLRLMKEHGVLPQESRLAHITGARWNNLRLFVAALAVPSLVIVLTFPFPEESYAGTVTNPVVMDNTDAKLWAEGYDSSNGVAVSVTPIPKEAENRLGFHISFETHTVDLNFHVDQIVELSLNGTPTMIPAKWIGPPPGGHHVAGELWFEDVPADINDIQLTLAGVAGKDRRFQWNK